MKSKISLIFLLIVLLGLIAIDVYLRLRPFKESDSFVSPLGAEIQKITQKPLVKYSFPNLKNTIPEASVISLDSILSQENEYTSYLFSFTTEGHIMTGQLNVPTVATPSGGFPAILLLRGYVDKEIYTPGTGTKSAAAYFATNGYVTIAPDYFGYGGSDDPPISPMGERLRRPLNTIDLMASLNSLAFMNPSRLGMWGHSNGGQLALSVLEITGRPIPTTLWAPVTKPFPFSILFFTDEHADQGKALRKTVADFEKDYDVFDYSIDKYFSDITAPLQLHQGTSDEAVPLKWSNDFVQTLKKLDKNISYFTYPGADHNLRPGWDTVVKRDLQFFRDHL